MSFPITGAAYISYSQLLKLPRLTVRSLVRNKITDICINLQHKNVQNDPAKNLTSIDQQHDFFYTFSIRLSFTSDNVSDCDADSLTGQDQGQSSNGQQGKNGNAGQAGGKGKRDRRRGKSGKKGKKSKGKEGGKGERQGGDGQGGGGQGYVEPPGGEEGQGAGWSRLKRVSAKSKHWKISNVI